MTSGDVGGWTMGHLKDENVTYFQHWWFAIRFGLVMLLAGGCVIIHAFFPELFKTTGSSVVRAMAAVLDGEQDGSQHDRNVE